MDKINEQIVKFSKKYGLNPTIVYGICKQESTLNPLAARHEPDYKWVWKPKEVKPQFCSIDTERMLQKTSFGLMQVMGAVYREHGFTGWLTEVASNVELQLDYGCKHLSKKIAKYGRDGGIVAYNSGIPRTGTDGKYVNQYYLDNVLKYAGQVSATDLLVIGTK